MPRIPSTERRELLTSAALLVIGTKGLAQATTRAIVAEAGMSLASFHYAFRSRDELLVEVIQRVGDAEISAAKVSLRPGSGIRESLGSGFRAILDYVIADPGHERALQELLHHAMVTPGLDHLAVAHYDGHLRAVTEFLGEAAHTAGVQWIEPVTDIARFVVTMTDGIALGWLADHDTSAAARMIELAVAAIAQLSEPALVSETRSTHT